MLSDESFCRALRRTFRVGPSGYLVVVKWVEWKDLRRRTSIPTAALAAKRFEAAVLASTREWVEAGYLSDAHLGMILPTLPTDIVATILTSIEQFAFIDPWSNAGLITMNAVPVSVDLANYDNESAALNSVERLLLEAEGKVPQELDGVRPRTEWCLDPNAS